jgi:hypothetical protein
VAQKAKSSAAWHRQRGSAIEKAAAYARQALTTAEISKLLGVQPRTARGYLQAAREQGLDVEPAPTETTDGDQTGNQRAPRPRKRQPPKAFAERNRAPGGRIGKVFFVGGPGGFGYDGEVEYVNHGTDIPADATRYISVRRHHRDGTPDRLRTMRIPEADLPAYERDPVAFQYGEAASA